MPADPILTVAWLVLAHLVADFIVQTGSVVAAKNAPGPRGWQGLAAHGLGVAVCLVPAVLAFGLPGLWVLLVIAVSHVVIDRIKVLLTRRAERRAVAAADRRHEGRAPAAGLGRAWTPMPAAYFALDQAAHLAVTFGAWAVWLAGGAPTAEWSSAVGRIVGGWEPAVVHDVTLGAVVLLSLVIANVRAGALFVGTLVRPIELGAEIRAVAGDATADPEATAHSAAATPGPSDPSGAGRRWDIRIGPVTGLVREEPAPAAPSPDPAVPPPTQLGATIGILERLLIVAFVLTSAEAAIGFVVAAKTIARFKLLDDRDFAEYYLLGTLGSVSVAILTGIVAKAALAA